MINGLPVTLRRVLLWVTDYEAAHLAPDILARMILFFFFFNFIAFYYITKSDKKKYEEIQRLM